MPNNLKSAKSGYGYKIKSTPAGELAQKLASVGLYKGSTLTKLDCDDIKYPTIKVNTKYRVTALAGQLAKHITVKAVKGEPKSLYATAPSSTVIIQSVGECEKNAERLAMLGIRPKLRIKVVKTLPHMEYVVMVNNKNRVRITEAAASMLIGSIEEKEDELQFSFAPKSVPFTVTDIAAGRRITAFFEGLGIRKNSVLSMEGIEAGKRIDIDPDTEVVLYTADGLFITMSAKTAALIETE